jgi:hypothetical protein
VTAEEYLRSVDFRLRDLPWRTRRELVSELRAHLTELPTDTDLGARLGAPEEYAADLRAAAGLERRHGPVALLRARRPRNLVLAIAALTAIGLAIGAVAWIQSYQPLAFAGTTLLPEGAKGNLANGAFSVVFHKGKPFRFGVTVRNDGRFAVRVLGVPYGSYLPFSARLQMSAPDESDGTAGPFMPFQPFDLKPGEIRVLVFKGLFACHTGMAAGTGITLVDFPIRFRFLWRTATARIPLRSQVAIGFRKGAACPATR